MRTRALSIPTQNPLRKQADSGPCDAPGRHIVEQVSVRVLKVIVLRRILLKAKENELMQSLADWVVKT